MVAARLTLDPAGNMTTVPKPASLANGLTLKYDAWNRLVEVRDGGNKAARYDGLNRRTVTVRYISGAASNHDHRYYNASWQVLETRVHGLGGQPETAPPWFQYVWSARYIDSPVLRDWNSDSDNYCDDHRLYYLGDANFNVTTLVDTGGDALERYLYEPYGVLTIYTGDWSSTRSSSSYSNVYLYTGRERDEETGYYYCRNRYYHAELGRFISRDPIGYDGGVNVYAYATSRPTALLDPSGQTSGHREEIEKLFGSGTPCSERTSEGIVVFSQLPVLLPPNQCPAAGNQRTGFLIRVRADLRAWLKRHYQLSKLARSEPAECPEGEVCVPERETTVEIRLDKAAIRHTYFWRARRPRPLLGPVGAVLAMRISEQQFPGSKGPCTVDWDYEIVYRVTTIEGCCRPEFWQGSD